jgi:hypothetical protein
MKNRPKPGQWVFTIPKRLRVYFRFDRSLLGKLCRAAWETVRDVYALEVDGDSGVPAMVGAVQTFGDLVHWHSHVHARFLTLISSNGTARKNFQYIFKLTPKP